MDSVSQGWAVWVVGLPGSGKSTVVNGMRDYLVERGVDVSVLAMDRRRKTYFPKPTYSKEEREQAYAMFVDEAVALVGQGRKIIMDGSAYAVSMRRHARSRIANFAEIFIQCDLEEAMRREASRPKGAVMAGLYRKALNRKETGQWYDGLGEVIGVDVPFEVDPDAELIIDNTSLSREETLERVLHFLDSWLASA